VTNISQINQVKKIERFEELPTRFNSCSVRSSTIHYKYLLEEKMSKKIFTLLALFLLASLVLAACAPSETEAPSPTEAPVLTKTPVATEAPAMTESPTEVPAAGVMGTVTLWHSWNEFEVESLQEVIDAFQEKYPEVQFDVLYVPFDDLRGKFESAAATGGGPTVLIGAADWGPAFYDAALVADLTGQVSDDLIGTINPAGLGAVQYKDALIGLPETIRGVVMFRNKTIIPDAPATWKDLLEAAQTATQGDVVGADLETGLYFSAGYLDGCRGQLMDENGDPAFNNVAGVCWLNMLKEYTATGLPMEHETENDVNLFKEGKVGVIVDGTWNTGALSEAIGAENLVIDPWPTTEQGALSGYIQTENIYLSTNTTENDTAANLAFIEFFMSPEAQAILAEPTKAAHIPAVVGVKPRDPLIEQTAAAFAGGIKFPLLPEMNAYWEPLNNAILSVINNGAVPAEALQTAEEQVIAKIKEIRSGD
jgi:maltose-binding protein MalE